MAFSAASRKSPVGAMNFMPFHCMGLWLAVTLIPPAACSCSTASWTVGVGQMPISWTEIPLMASVEMIRSVMAPPVIRPSRPTMTTGDPGEVPRQYALYAET